MLLLAAVLLTGWAASWVRYAQLSRMAGVARRSVLRLRERVYAHVLALPMAFFDKAITGQLVSRVTNDTEAVNQLYRQVLYVMLDSSIVVAGSLVVLSLVVTGFAVAMIKRAAREHARVLMESWRAGAASAGKGAA